MMTDIKSKIYKILNSEQIWVIVSIMTIQISIFRPVNDVDNMINAYITNGLYQETAQTWNIYSGVQLQYLIGTLHRHFEHINFYIVITWLAAGQQVCILNYWVQSRLRASTRIKHIIYLIEIAVVGSLLQVLNMNYTVQSAFSMCIQMVCMDIYLQKSKNKQRIAWLVMQVLYQIYGIQLRVKQGLLIIPYLGICILLNLTRSKRQAKEIFCIVLPLILGMTQLAPDIYLIKNNADYADQYYYDKYRAYFQDYSNDYGSYVQAQAGLWVLDDIDSINRQTLEDESKVSVQQHVVENAINGLILGAFNVSWISQAAIIALALCLKPKYINKETRILNLCNDIGTIIIFSYFLFSGRYFGGLGRVWLCIAFAFVVTRLLILNDEQIDKYIQIRNYSAAVVIAVSIICYSLMQQIYTNIHSQCIQTYKQIYIDEVLYDDSNIVYGQFEAADLQADQLSNDKYIIYKEIGSTRYGMMQFKDSQIYNDKIYDKILSGEYKIALYDSSTEILDVLHIRYRNNNQQDVQFKLVGSQDGRNYYEIDKQIQH